MSVSWIRITRERETGKGQTSGQNLISRFAATSPAVQFSIYLSEAQRPLGTLPPMSASDSSTARTKYNPRIVPVRP